jgi:predicted DsbA family dithiol-disulfide isomerase
MAFTIEITEYTDPYCTWCWGSEPVLRHLQEAYSDQLSVRFVMGGLVEDIRTFHDAANGIGGSDWRTPLVAHWLEASQRHGMPVDVSGWATTDFRSTWPSNIAYEAAKLQNEVLANRYLRRMREVAATECGELSSPVALADIAEAVGLDRARFLVDFKGQAEDEFARDRWECGQRGVHGFPTFMVSVDSKERLAHGYRTYAQMTGMIDLLAGGPVERHKLDFSDLSVLDFVEKYDSAAVVEVAEVFEVAPAQAKAALDRLVTGGSLERPKPGLLYRSPVPVICDTATGQCF